MKNVCGLLRGGGGGCTSVENELFSYSLYRYLYENMESWKYENAVWYVPEKNK